MIITVMFEKSPYLLELHTEIFPDEMDTVSRICFKIIWWETKQMVERLAEGL